PVLRDGALVARLRAVLPFALTAAQERVVAEIAADLARPQPMHRLLQGDVGSGKTVVAALSAAVAVGAGWQCALMAPTEILEQQSLEPHLLMMSATPIPRTLAMSYFADLAVSTIDELPPGRTPVLTKVFADNRRADVVARIRDEVARGRQVYWVCPLVDESEHLDLQDAT